ncbi:MAG: hypothetical protein H7123_04150, partial [Thermoleophilia bacterium]|nr:hypothetical protein [Thermoleophilia bacterium]
AAQVDGKIIVSAVDSAAVDFGIERFLTNGTPDATFGTSGVSVIPVGTGQDWAHGVQIRPDGRIVVTGESVATAGAWDFSAIQLLADGTLDTSFGTAGKTIVDSGSGGWDFALTSVLQTDGKILLAGGCDLTTYKVCIARFTSTGALDTSYGTSGWLFLAPGSTDFAEEITVQPDGSALFAGIAYNGTNYDGIVAHVSTLGVLDASFGTAGYAKAPAGTATSYYSLQRLGDGRIIVAGVATVAGVSRSLTTRFESNGTLDTSYAGIGTDYRSFGTAGSSFLKVLLDADGSVVLAGNARNATDTDYMATRYIGTPVSNMGAGSSWSTGTQTFGACVRQLSTSTIGAPWTVAAGNTCTTTDSTDWQPVAATALTAGAIVATTTTGVATATADLRFGFRASPGQPPGRYHAPIVIELVAP